MLPSFLSSFANRRLDCADYVTPPLDSVFFAKTYSIPSSFYSAYKKLAFPSAELFLSDIPVSLSSDISGRLD